MLPYRIKSQVVKGKGRGRKLGIPTINFQIPPNLNIPFGVYAGRVYFGHRVYPAAIHFGPRPIFAEDDTSLEAYLLDHITHIPAAGDIQFVKFVRKIMDFPDPHSMVRQIERDVAEIKKILAATPIS